MFERFTEKAINVVIEAQSLAKEHGFSEVTPEHVLFALINQAKGVSLKIFRMNNLTSEDIKAQVLKSSKNKNENDDPIFSNDLKELLKHTLDLASQSGNQNILFEHIFLSIITTKKTNIVNILDEYNFDISSATELLTKLVQRKIKRLEHPETIDEEEKDITFESIYENSVLSEIFNQAVSKSSASGYEILGTEQIIESILESADSELLKTINNNGIDLNNFEKQLELNKKRQLEFEDKKIVFTPNAFFVMNKALEIAKELGSSEVLPEHIILSVLKTKKGLAYEIFKSLNINENKLTTDILKPIEKQMQETLMIMKIAKEEARRLGRNTVGTEMFLLGIIGEGTSIAAEVLNDLEVTIKDARKEVENLIGFGNEYFEKEIVFTSRAKKVLERAWLKAKKSNRQRIEAVDILFAIIEEPTSLAMKVLNNLGVDAIEIRYGITAKNN